MEWDNADWNNNRVVANAVTIDGNTFSNGVYIDGLGEGVASTFGVRVADGSGKEDINTNTLMVFT